MARSFSNRARVCGHGVPLSPLSVVHRRFVCVVFFNSFMQIYSPGFRTESRATVRRGESKSRAVHLLVQALTFASLLSLHT